MSGPSLWDRLRHARIVQVLAVYLGASWVVLQITETLTEALALPAWVPPVAIILLLVGLVIILATAWVQSLPSTTAAEQAGERPTDWEIAPSDLLARLRAGKLPHLTWGRAILGGVFALSTLFGVSGAYVLFTGGRGILGPTEAGADPVAEGVAVLPFHVSGADLEPYREGMVDLLSATFDGVGGFRTIDARTVLARWSEEVGDTDRPDLDAALRAAARTGARFAVLGSMVPAGARLRMDVDIYDIDTGAKVGSARADGSPDEVFALVDGLSVGIARELLGTSGERLASPHRLESVTTRSLAALQDYLDGERRFRRGDFDGAVEAFERALAADSTFALAWARLAASLGWAAGGGPRSVEARRASLRFADRLTPREETLVRARVHYNEDSPEGVPLLEDFVRRHPDEAEAWYDLGDTYFHMGEQVPASREQSWSALRRAGQLDPGFAPYQIHLVDLAFAAHDSVAARTAVDAYAAAQGDENLYSENWDAGYAILFGDDDEARRGLAEASALEDPLRALGLLGLMIDRPSRGLELFRAAAERGAGSFPYMLALRRAGRWRESEDVLARTPSWLGAIERAFTRGSWMSLWELGEEAALHAAFDAVECADDLWCRFARSVALAEHGAAAGHASEADAARAALGGIVADLRSAGQDSATVRAAELQVQVLDGRVKLHAGDAAGAYEALRTAEREGRGDWIALARAAEQIGDPEAAERYYLAAAWREEGDYATYRLAGLYERTGRSADALEQYRRLALMWGSADEDFPPLLEIRAALERLGG